MTSKVINCSYAEALPDCHIYTPALCTWRNNITVGCLIYCPNDHLLEKTQVAESPMSQL